MLELIPDVLSVSEVADILKLSKSSVYKMLKNSEIVSYRVGIGNKIIRVNKEDLLDYIENYY